MTLETELHDELRNICGKGELEFQASSEGYFVLLEQRFPLIGSKIDWSQVPTSIERRFDVLDSERHADAAAAFMEEISASQNFAPETRIVVIGDSAMEGAVVLSLQVLRACLRSFVMMPQHTYVTNAEASWCMAFTMEGDLCFGRAPT